MTTLKTVFFCVTLLFSKTLLNAQQSGREVLPINSGWEFAKLDASQTETQQAQWTTVTLPHTWNDKDMQQGKDFYEGYGMYRKYLEVPQDWQNKRVFIRFEGVGQVAELYVNDRYIGKHNGSYAAFIFDVSHDLNFGVTNKIVVRVNNIATESILPTDHFLFGIFGGIYRPASLIVTNKTNITTTDYASPGVYIGQEKVTGEEADIRITTKLEHIEQEPGYFSLQTEIYNQEGQKVGQHHKDLKLSPQGRQVISQDIQLPRPHLWQGKADPYLHKVVVTLKDSDSTVVDQVIQPLGIRTFEIKPADGLYLNGSKYKMYGVCRHQDRQDFGNALLPEHHDEDLDIMNEMGVTTIRFAHYQQSEYLYSKCDSLGFVIWAEIPFINKTMGHEAENAKLQLEELIKQNYNHPSIYIWGLHNEIYSNSEEIHKKGENYGTVLTRDLHDLAKRLDPYRPTVSVDNGDMNRPVNKQANVQGFNRYYGWYGGTMNGIKKWVEEYKTKYPDYAVVLAEYGAGGNMAHQEEVVPEKVDPKGQYFPESYATRFHETQWGDIANQQYLIASYVWNMFDFSLPLWVRGGVPARNHKGLVTYDRKEKKDAFYWYKANWNPEPMVYISDRRVTQRKNPVTDIHVYANTGNVKLSVNGKPHQTVEIGKTAVHYIFTQVPLQKGENRITVTAGTADELKDEVVWVLVGE